MCHPLQEVVYHGTVGDKWHRPDMLKEQERLRHLLPDRLEYLQTEYRAMMYGSSATPDETSAHFTRAKTGVIFTGTEGAHLMYKSRQ
jgi:hypothetical protein